MDSFTSSILLEYFYEYSVTFILSIIGISIKELMVTNTDIRTIKKINIPRMIVSSVICSFVICAAIEYMHMPFGVYVLICVIVGIWSEVLVNIILNKNIMSKIALKVAKTVLPAPARDVIEAVMDDKTDNKQNDNNTTQDKKDNDKKVE